MTSILLIDDNEEFSRLMQIGLGRLGHKVTIAFDGDEGLRALRANSYDIVITDIIMPGREGLETIIEVKRMYPDMPILAISGGGITGKTAFLEAAKKLGATDALEKPFSIAYLNASILQHTQSSGPSARKKRTGKWGLLGG
jgi:DNA-binding NtrC family response regulator